jgi:RND family efflux transporter MFP subunit
MKRGFSRCVVLLVLLSAMGCSREAPVAPVLAKQKIKKIAAGEETVAQELSSFGSLSFRSKTDITATIEGTVEIFDLEEGESVKKGRLIARLKNIQVDMRKEQAGSALRSAQSALELAKSRLWEGQLQVEARIVSVQKAELELAQKRDELAELERTLKNKEQLFNVGGTTEEAMSSLKLSYASAQTNIRLLEKDLDMKKIGLRDEDIVSQGMKVPKDEASRKKALVQLNTKTLLSEIEVARSRVESAQTDLRSAAQLLAELEIRSPADGIVGAKYVEKGEHVAADTKILTLIDTTDVYAVFPLSEADAAHVTEGMAVETRVEAVSATPFKATVELISPMIDPQAGTVTIKALIGNPNGKLKPGMFARVRIVYGTPQKVVTIPQSSISQKKGDTARVFTVVNNRAFVKEVALGTETSGSYVVTKGLSRGEILIDSPSPLLKEGEEVETE